jgi:hypothetical protein
MKRTIWKYPIATTDVQVVHMPAGSQILSVQVQFETPCLWVLVDSEAALIDRVIRIYGTGHLVDQPGRYIGSYQLDRGALVFHVFEVSREHSR